MSHYYHDFASEMNVYDPIFSTRPRSFLAVLLIPWVNGIIRGRKPLAIIEVRRCVTGRYLAA